MNQAYRTTLLMLIIAGAAAATAASVYPWPEAVVVSEAVNNPLFKDFDTSNVRSIRIAIHNTDRNEVETLIVRRKGERWILPTHQNFIADNGAQLGKATNLLLDKIVLEKRSDNQEDHLKYGVVDPAEMNSTVNRSSVGKKITLSDRNNRELASLIVGLPVKNDPTKKKHYVRVPGQPSVYVVEIDPAVINPNFQAWVNPNLMRLTNGSEILDVVINRYRLDSDALATAERQDAYQATVAVKDDQLDVQLQLANDAGELKPAELSPQQKQLIQIAAGAIGRFPFTDVQAKSKAISKALRKPDQKTERTVFDPMAQYGFRATDFENETWQFESTGGSVTIRTSDGVVVEALVGAIDSQARNSSLKLSHYMMLAASFDESLVPMPEKADGESEEDKAYLRKIADRDKQLAIGRQRAGALNQSFAKWYYVVSEDFVARLCPELK